MNGRDLLALAGATAIAIVLVAALRRGLGWLLGPVFVHETARLVRRGHVFWLRVGFGLLTLGMLFAAKPDLNFDPKPESEMEILQRVGPRWRSWDEPPVTNWEARLARTRESLAKFADDFSAAFRLVLVVAAMAATPLFFASAITEEKERRSLDFLLGTSLSSWDIVIGKYAARLLNLVGVILTAVPILALTQFWGGVDWRLIIHSFVVALVVMASYGAVATMCSAMSARTRSALLAVYPLVLLPELLLHVAESPYTILNVVRRGDVLIAALSGDAPGPEVEEQVFAVAFLGAFHVVGIIGALAIAVKALRRFAARHAGRTRRVMTAQSTAVVPHPMTVAPNPPLVGDPLVWKEAHIGRTVGGWFLGSAFWLYAYLLLGILLVLAAVIWFGDLHEYMAEFGLVMRVIPVLLATMVLVTVMLRMAGVVSGEREQQTLDSLLAAPFRRDFILWAKWIGTLRRARRALIGLFLCFIVAGLINDIPMTSWLLLPFLFLAHLCFFGNLGMLLSVLCSTSRARTLVLVGLVLTVATGWTSSYFDAKEQRFERPRWSEERVLRPTGKLVSDHVISDLDDWTDPPQTWWRLLWGQQRVGLGDEMFAVARLNRSDSNAVSKMFHWSGYFRAWMIYLILGFFFWTLAHFAFRRRSG